jgi:gliding motility associated protien GldN
MKLFGKFLMVLFVLGSLHLHGQEKPRVQNPNSIRPIDEEDVHYRARLWRRMDLNEKINQPFFSINNEISKYLVEWVKAGVLVPYKNDSLLVKLSAANFVENLKMEETTGDGELSEAERAAGFGGEVAKDAKKPETKGGAGSDDGWGAGGAKATAGTAEVATKDNFDAKAPISTVAYYFPKELSIIEIKEDAVIDRKRSRLYFDIQALTLIVPASKTKAGFDKAVASFRYKDVYKLFRSNPDCIWYNSENETQHKNMADAFDLRMFQARIIKKGNAENKYLTDMFEGEKEGLLMSQLLEYKLLELEHDMWEN